MKRHTDCECVCQSVCCLFPEARSAELKREDTGSKYLLYPEKHTTHTHHTQKQNKTKPKLLFSLSVKIKPQIKNVKKSL